MNDEEPHDLRTRRKRDTRREIHRAALDLFEERGVRETTVQQIADRVGISARTFFRYFATKEQAALPAQRGMLAMIDAFEVPGDDPAVVLAHLERATEGVIADTEHEEHFRIARLLARESDFRALVGGQQLQLAERLARRLSQVLTDADPTTVRLLAETSVTVWRTCWDRWGESAALGVEREPVEVYRECCLVLRRITGAGAFGVG